jgi:hypothetical protein
MCTTHLLTESRCRLFTPCGQVRPARTSDVTPFAFQPPELRKIVETKDFATLEDTVKDTKGLLRGLLTDARRGITTSEGNQKYLGGDDESDAEYAPRHVSLAERRRIYGSGGWAPSSASMPRIVHHAWVVVASLELSVIKNKIHPDIGFRSGPSLISLCSCS